MEKINVKHPIIIFLITFIFVMTAGLMKVLKFESADFLIDLTFSVSVISLIYALVRLKKTKKVY